MGIERIIFGIFSGSDKIRAPCRREFFMLIIPQTEAYAAGTWRHLQKPVQILYCPTITAIIFICVPTSQ
jgi:hypothetical protein